MLIVSLCIPVFLLGSPQRKTALWSLEKCVKQALAANKDYLIAQEKVQKAKAQEQAAFAGLFPSLSFNSTYTRRENSISSGRISISYSPHHTSLGLSAGYAIPWIPYFSDGAWGAARKKYRIAKENLKLSHEQLVEIRIGIRSTVAKHFYSVLLNQEIVSVTAANQKRLQAYVDVAARNFGAGRVSRYELLRTRVQLANNTPLLLQAENQLRLAKVSLLQTMGLNLDTPFLLKGRLKAAMVRLSEEKAITMALSNRFELRELTRAKAIQKYTIALQKASRRPMLTIFGNLNWEQSGDSFLVGSFKRNWNVGLQLSLPISEIFPWSKTRYNLKAAEIDLRVYDKKIARVKDVIRYQLRQILLRLQEHKRTIDTQKIAIRLSARGLGIARTRFASGQMGNVELTDANLDYQQAQLNLYRAWFQYISARYDLLKAIGVEKLK